MATTTDTTPKAQTKKQRKAARAKARRLAKRGQEVLAETYKPIEEWDQEELARGRPRNPGGGFQGPAPRWISRQIHEEAIRRFKDLSQGQLRGLVPEALDQLRFIVTNDETDADGKRLVPMSTKLDAIKFTVEHLLGKPTARVEMDISARLQAMLGVALVNPDGQNAIEVHSWEGPEEDSDEDGEAP